VEISPARRRDRHRFVELPFRLARSVPQWRPGLRKLARDLIDPERNPFWLGRTASFFTVVTKGRVVGRIGVLGPGEIPQRPAAATFLFPDFEDDPAVVRILIECACAAAKGVGARELVGPMNPNIHHDVGIQVEGFQHRNAVFMGYQPAYYARHLEALGFETLHDFQAWSLFRDDFVPGGRIGRLAERVLRAPALRIRFGDLDRFEDEAEVLFQLYARSFADHWGFRPPTREEFHFLARELRPLLRPRMVLVAEWEGEPVGFALAVPDLYSILPVRSAGRLTPGLVLHLLRHWRRVDVVRVMIAGVLPSHRAHGIHLPLFHRITREVFALGFQGGEISWVMRSNVAMVRALESLGASPTKTYRLFRKALPA
jgi:hypothetical protein